MQELDGAAKEAGITVLNEVGMDPGVDHLYAIKLIGEVHEKGRKVKEFYSFCGGLPASEAADNPPGSRYVNMISSARSHKTQLTSYSTVLVVATRCLALPAHSATYL